MSGSIIPTLKMAVFLSFRKNTEMIKKMAESRRSTLYRVEAKNSEVTVVIVFMHDPNVLNTRSVIHSPHTQIVRLHDQLKLFSITRGKTDFGKKTKTSDGIKRENLSNSQLTSVINSCWPRKGICDHLECVCVIETWLEVSDLKFCSKI